MIRAGGGFLVLGVTDAQDVACILYQSMLKAPSGAHERLAMLAGKPDTRQRTFHAAVRAARRTPQAVVGLQDAPNPAFLNLGSLERGRGDPIDCHVQTQRLPGVLEGCGRGVVSGVGRVKIPEYADTKKSQFSHRGHREG